MASKAEEGEYERENLERRFKNSNPDEDTQKVDFEGEYDSSLSYHENVENMEKNTGVKLQSKAEITRESGVRNIKTQEQVFRDEQGEKRKEYMEKKYGAGYWKERKPRIVSTSGYEKERQANVYKQLTPLEKAKVFVHTTVGSKYGRERIARQAFERVRREKGLVKERLEKASASNRSGGYAFVLGKTNRPPLAPKYRGRYQRVTPYVAQQIRRPFRYYGAPVRAGPQSGAPDRLPQKGYSDGLPQNWGPTRNYRVASNLHLFGEWSGAGSAQSPIAKYGGGLPRFFDKPRGVTPQSRARVGVNSSRSMFKKGVFG